MLTIALDAMGGDRAPSAEVEGAVLAAEELGVRILLVGQPGAIESELARHPGRKPFLEIVAASETVVMAEAPSLALRKKDSSMRVAVELVKRREAQAVVSAGNSGAMMAMGMFVLGNLSGVERPAISVIVPTLEKGAVIIDAGANTECKPRHLLQFGLMGAIYAEHVLRIARPRVGVLSNGEEEGKGTELTRAASERLRATGLDCIGYVEGRDICAGNVDVVVCDGFTGNVTLKTMEGLGHFVMQLLTEAFRRDLLSRLGYLLSQRSLRKAFARLDYAEYGGAPLLGLDGVAIIAHGGSTPKAIKNAIRAARESVSHDINRHIVEILKQWGEVRGPRDTEKIERKSQFAAEVKNEPAQAEAEELGSVPARGGQSRGNA